ncbi:hypothetical protein ASZ78_010557 [Callipepla squamata]|uniref:WAP four-disulfide core domain protein 8 n=1 Tax=Callipepla squamata TaxID=9009 RepID=A0A226MQK1_CALSU|nr:hypothetical protein ASZ78_010557 [Callipepla squamata]
MPKASSALLLAGLLVLWAELLPASVLNVTIKAGVCPEPAVEEANCTMGCQSDGDCESTLKCCPAACGKACQEPNAKSGLCPRKRARRDAVCPNLCTDDRDCPGDKKCCFSGCGLACTAPYTAKSGACPVVLRGSLGPCLEHCDSDADCPGTKKCCTTGCGHVCKLPTEGELQKPGLCPRDFTQCLHQEPPLCTNDSACPGWLKCCSHECRLRCTPPAEAAPAPLAASISQGRDGAEKPGACPAAAPEGLFYPCSFRCQEDKDCLGSQKCCPLGCGPACVEPVHDICHLPAAPGPCGGHEMSFFYNVTSGHCEKFRYSGCRGNANRFGTQAACRRACLSHGKDGFCPASSGLFPSYDCREWCRHDADCPGKEKCCLQGCDYVCLRPAQEKPGICPLSEQAAGSECQAPCAGDEQCPGDEKCCSSRCGRTCMAPEPDKPGRCPKVRLQLTSEPCTEEDDCLHDRDCPRQEKCCFSGCAMRCSRPAREHPGQCPQAEPCGDPRHRRRNQCLDDSVCGRDEKCCYTGCAWACVAVLRESGGGTSGQCTEECKTDAQCPEGQRCTHTGCSRVCVDIPGGRVGVCPILRDGRTCLELCSFDEQCPWGQKCCSNGCGHACMPASLEELDAAIVPQHIAGRCPEQCDTDSQCPQGQRCTRSSCGRVCMDMPRGPVQVTSAA